MPLGPCPSLGLIFITHALRIVVVPCKHQCHNLPSSVRVQRARLPRKPSRIHERSKRRHDGARKAQHTSRAARQVAVQKQHAAHRPRYVPMARACVDRTSGMLSTQSTNHTKKTFGRQMTSIQQRVHLQSGQKSHFLARHPANQHGRRREEQRVLLERVDKRTVGRNDVDWHDTSDVRGGWVVCCCR